MKKSVYYFLLPVIIPLLFITLTSEIAYHTGSPGGKTGSPGDNGLTCTGCHMDIAEEQPLWIFIPELLGGGGYTPGMEYNVVVTGHHPDAVRFGFEATAEDDNGNKVGVFTADFSDRTQTINGNKSITHTSGGVMPLADTATSWFFTWTAPATAIGNITFYTAVNAANGNNSTSGDQIYTSSFIISPATVAPESEIRNFSVYPNPVKDKLIILSNEQSKSGWVEIFDLLGAPVARVYLGSSTGQFDVSPLDPGIYLVRLGISTVRFIKD